jgi:two-component system cell cycle sensor histidine kinase/response regulator CckA
MHDFPHMMRRALPNSSATPPVAPSQGSSPRSGPTTPTVLVVDDDPAMLSVVSRLLSRDGVHVLRAIGPEQAVQLFDREGHSVDLVLSDITMPNMDGPELIAKLRERHPNLPVLYMSALAYEFAHTISEPMLQKPFSRQQLMHHVNALLPHGAATDL